MPHLWTCVLNHCFLGLCIHELHSETKVNKKTKHEGKSSGFTVTSESIKDGTTSALGLRMKVSAATKHTFF